jgi:hypothetical protein
MMPDSVQNKLQQKFEQKGVQDQEVKNILSGIVHPFSMMARVGFNYDTQARLVEKTENILVKFKNFQQNYSELEQIKQTYEQRYNNQIMPKTVLNIAEQNIKPYMESFFQLFNYYKSNFPSGCKIDTFNQGIDCINELAEERMQELAKEKDYKIFQEKLKKYEENLHKRKKDDDNDEEKDKQPSKSMKF